MSLSALSAGHLERCSTPGCRSFILDADVRCTRCGVDRPSFKVFKASLMVGKYVMLPLLAVFAIVAISMAIQKQVRTHKDQIQLSQ